MHMHYWYFLIILNLYIVFRTRTLHEIYLISLIYNLLYVLFSSLHIHMSYSFCTGKFRNKTYCINIRLISKYTLHFLFEFIKHIFKPWSFEMASLAHLQVFFDLMREIRSRKIEDKSASNGRGKDRAKRKKKKCKIL